MSQLSEYLQFKTQIRNEYEEKIPISPKLQQKKKEDKKSKSNYSIKRDKYKSPKQQLFLLPSEFPLSKDNNTWCMIKYKGLFQNLNQKHCFL